MISGETVRIKTTVDLANISPTSIKVEVLYGKVINGVLENPDIIELSILETNKNGSYVYYTDLKLLEGGEYGYTFRILPENQSLINRFDLGLIKWAVQ